MNRGRWTAMTAAAVMVSAFTASTWADNGAIKGKVVFKGDPKKYRRMVLDTSKDPNCKKIKAKIGSENVILNTKTDPVTIRNTMVYVKEGLGDRKFPVKAGSVLLNQRGCQYEPHVVGIQEGQDLVVKNSDDTNHNIHFLPKVNEELNFSQPKQNMEKSVTLKTEDVFKAKCDVHPWMGCYIRVFDHPFFAVTEEDGTFEIKGLPAGSYTVEAWHEEFGAQTMTVKLEVDETKEADFTYEPDK